MRRAHIALFSKEGDSERANGPRKAVEREDSEGDLAAGSLEGLRAASTSGASPCKSTTKSFAERTPEVRRTFLGTTWKESYDPLPISACVCARVCARVCACVRVLCQRWRLPEELN